jgi:hypothetical protein
MGDSIVPVKIGLAGGAAWNARFWLWMPKVGRDGVRRNAKHYSPITNVDYQASGTFPQHATM